MFGIGMPEMILILVVALLVIGPKKLPDLAKSLGRAIGEFRKAATDIKDSISAESDVSSVKTSFENLGKETTPPADRKSEAAETPSHGPSDQASTSEHQDGETPPRESGKSPD